MVRCNAYFLIEMVYSSLVIVITQVRYNLLSWRVCLPAAHWPQPMVWGRWPARARAPSHPPSPPPCSRLRCSIIWLAGTLCTTSALLSRSWVSMGLHTCLKISQGRRSRRNYSYDASGCGVNPGVSPPALKTHNLLVYRTPYHSCLLRNLFRHLGDLGLWSHG